MSVVVDTSVCIDHLRADEAGMRTLLLERKLLMHPFVIGELAIGSLGDRNRILATLSRLPQADIVEDSRVLDLISQHQLFGVGIGYVDAHLLAAVHLTPGAALWTRDKRLLAQAHRLGCAYSAPGAMLV